MLSFYFLINVIVLGQSLVVLDLFALSAGGVAFLQRSKSSPNECPGVQLAGAIEYIDCISAER